MHIMQIWLYSNCLSNNASYMNLNFRIFKNYEQMHRLAFNLINICYYYYYALEIVNLKRSCCSQY